MAEKINGVALASIGAGVLFAYAGIKGYSIPQTIKSVIQGKDPRQQPVAQPVTSPVGGTGSSAGSSDFTGGAPKSERQWITDVLGQLNAPATSKNISSVEAWVSKECQWNNQPPDGAEYTKNPLNMTQVPGAVRSINSVGVSVIPTWDLSVTATASRISGGTYNDILMALRSGRGLCGLSLTGLSTWSGGGYSSVC